MYLKWWLSLIHGFGGFHDFSGHMIFSGFLFWFGFASVHSSISGDAISVAPIA